MKLNPDMANMLGALGEGALSVCPWLLDESTTNLLSRAGYHSDNAAKIYTGIRLAFATLVLVLVMSLTVGMINPILAFFAFPFSALGAFLLPNWFLSGQARH